MSEVTTDIIDYQVFVARLNPRITERDLKYKFQKFGEIKDLRLKKGYAFIDYENSEEAQRAIDKMNGKEMEGQKIVVQASKRNKDKGDRERRREGGMEELDSRRKGPQSNDECFNCGKTGHWANECRESIKARQNFRDRDDMRCYKCGEKGHKQISCRRGETRRRNRSDSRGRSTSRRRHSSKSSSSSRHKRKRSSSSYSSK